MANKKKTTVEQMSKAMKGRKSVQHTQRVVPNKKKSQKNSMVIQMDGWSNFGTGSSGE